MRKHALKLTSLIAVALAVTFLGPQRAAADDDDPPTRVARLSQAEGSVSFEPAGTEDWGDGGCESASDHWRQAVGRPRFASRIASRLCVHSAWRQHRLFIFEP